MCSVLWTLIGQSSGSYSTLCVLALSTYLALSNKQVLTQRMCSIERIPCNSCYRAKARKLLNSLYRKHIFEYLVNNFVHFYHTLGRLASSPIPQCLGDFDQGPAGNFWNVCTRGHFSCRGTGYWRDVGNILRLWLLRMHPGAWEHRSRTLHSQKALCIVKRHREYTKTLTFENAS